MAMLAEKRTKTKYFLHHKVLNAKGFSCLQGSDSYGHRMLEKMGWSQGKGLGTNMDGIKEPIKLTYKCDNKGIGCDKSRDGEEAVAQQKEFDALLATLSQEATDKDDNASDPFIKDTPTSLELRSQKSRARVHYHKFTRGKDLSRATSKDLASILGAPAPKANPEPAPVMPTVGPVLTFDNIETAGTNMRDYFKEKIESKKRKIEIVELSTHSKKSKVSNSVDQFSEEQNLDSEENMTHSDKAKSQKKNKKLNSDVDSHDVHESVSKERRKSVTWGEVEVSFVSKYIKDMVDTSSESLTGDTSAEKQYELESSKESRTTCDKKKKKKNKKEKNSESSDFGLNDEDGISDGSIEQCDKKKRRHNKSEESVVDNEPIENHSLQITLSKKQRKQKRNQEELDRADMDEDKNCIQGSDDHDIASGVEKKKRKKKKSKHCEEIISFEECVEKKNKENAVAGDFDSIQENCDTVIDSVSIDQQKGSEEGKRKKKKKKKKNKESVSVDVAQSNITDNENSKLDYVPVELPKSNLVPCDSSNTPVLSALTQARMEKWKKSKKNNLKKYEVKQSEDHVVSVGDLDKNNVAEVDEKSNSEVNMREKPSNELQWNPNQPTLDYNHRKVLVTLGVGSKLKSGKVISVVMPESKFKGSNLDSLPGYGRAIPLM